MAELSRRFFLGGAISLLAVTTSAMPKLIGNLPQIWGDGRRDDTDGIGALLRNEPTVFMKDKITVDAHKGITFHNGIFTVSRTIEIPEDCELSMDRPQFRALGLPLASAFFRAPQNRWQSFASQTIANVWFLAPPEHGPFIEYPGFDADEEFERDGADMKRRLPGVMIEDNGDIHWKAA